MFFDSRGGLPIALSYDPVYRFVCAASLTGLRSLGYPIHRHGWVIDHLDFNAKPPFYGGVSNPKFSMTSQRVWAVLLGVTLCASCTPKTDNASSVPPAQQQEIKISGSSSAYPAIKLLIDAYRSKAPDTTIELLPPSQSESAIASVKEGLVDVGSISKALKPEENDGSLAYQEIAKDALVVATHPSVKGVSDLKTEQLQAIYSGATTNWQAVGGPNETIVVLDRPEDESTKRLLREHYLGKDLKNAPDTVVLRHEDDLISATQNTPYTIGAFSLAYAISHQLPVNRLSLNGIAATPENVEAGQYKMVRHIGIVYKKSPSAATQKFIDFVFSSEGTEHLRKAGFIPSSPSSSDR
jgi:phosphate transport system substrate-binding protein